MRSQIGLANRRLQPLGHISERGNAYSFELSASNRGSESAESAESKREQRGPDSGPTPVSFQAVEPQAEPAPAGAAKRRSSADVAAKSAAVVVPEQVTRFGAALKRQRDTAAPVNLSLRKQISAARRRERDGYSAEGPPEAAIRPISVGDDPLLAALMRGAR